MDPANLLLMAPKKKKGRRSARRPKPPTYTPMQRPRKVTFKSTVDMKIITARAKRPVPKARRRAGTKQSSSAQVATGEGKTSCQVESPPRVVEDGAPVGEEEDAVIEEIREENAVVEEEDAVVEEEEEQTVPKSRKPKKSSRFSFSNEKTVVLAKPQIALSLHNKFLEKIRVESSKILKARDIDLTAKKCLLASAERRLVKSLNRLMEKRINEDDILFKKQENLVEEMEKEILKIQSSSEELRKRLDAQRQKERKKKLKKGVNTRKIVV